MLIHLLDERGHLHIGDRVAEYIPEYAAQRQGRPSRIEHVLSPPGRRRQPARARRSTSTTSATRSTCCEIMCDARPRTRPGKLLAYHAVSGGFILAEIAERVTGKPSPRR